MKCSDCSQRTATLTINETLRYTGEVIEVKVCETCSQARQELQKLRNRKAAEKES